MMQLICEYIDVIAWSYEDMPSLDFRDLNKACPNEEFPLPITDVMINNTFGYERWQILLGGR